MLEEEVRYGKLVYTYRLSRGPTTITDYGIRLMKSLDFPKEMKEDAMKIADHIKQKHQAALPVVKPVSLCL